MFFFAEGDQQSLHLPGKADPFWDTAAVIVTEQASHPLTTLVYILPNAGMDRISQGYDRGPPYP